MQELGVEQVFIDKMSGKNTDRPELKRMMSFVREGDTLVVESISRFARNTRDLLDLTEQLAAKNVEFVSKKEAIDTSTATGNFMLTIFGAVAELEREYILQRQKEGIAYLTATPPELMRHYSEHRFKQQLADEPTLAVTEYIKSEPLIKAIIAGHLHFDYDGAVTPTLPQYVTGIGTVRTIILK